MLTKKNYAAVIVLIFLSLFIVSQVGAIPLSSIEGFSDDSTPVTNEGQPWQMVCIEYDPYVEFTGHLYGIVRGLAETGWIKSIDGIPYEEGSVDSLIMWEWLVEHASSEYIEFAPDGFYTLMNMSEAEEEQMLQRIQQQEDVDLVLVMGTRASELLANEVQNVPVLSFVCTNAYLSGIIESVEDSGQDNLWAHIDPDLFIRQLMIFHDIFEFETLGIVYEDTAIGRTISAVDDVYQFAAEHNIQVFEAHVDEAVTEDDMDRFNRELNMAYQELAPQVDAFYLTPNTRDVQQTYLYQKPFYEHQVPVFNMEGISDVEYGALMTVQRFDFNEIGMLGANIVGRVLNGTKPRYLEQRFVESPSISINAAVAEIIGYQIPFEILMTADRIYMEIGDE